MIALHQDIAPCINLLGIRFHGTIHGIDHRPVLVQLHSPRALTDSAFKMAPVYKFALIQMQPKVSLSPASSIQTDVMMSVVFTTAANQHVKSFSTMA